MFAAEQLLSQGTSLSLVAGRSQARAHRWQRPLDEGRFGSISERARELAMDVSLVARLMRLTLLAPDIVETILAGEAPSGLSLTMLTKLLPVAWTDQRNALATAAPLPMDGEWPGDPDG